MSARGREREERGAEHVLDTYSILCLACAAKVAAKLLQASGGARGKGRGGMKGAAIEIWSAAELAADYLTYVASVCFVRRRVKRLRDFPRFARAKAKQSEIFGWGQSGEKAK